MKALLTAYGDTSRRVWVSDSFAGVPNAKRQKEHPAFKGIPSSIRDMDIKQWGGHVVEPGLNGRMQKKNILTVEGKYVEDNFKRYGLFDDRVNWARISNSRFLEFELEFLPLKFSKVPPNHLHTLRDSFSAVSTPIFAGEYSLESS